MPPRKKNAQKSKQENREKPAASRRRPTKKLEKVPAKTRPQLNTCASTKLVKVQQPALDAERCEANNERSALRASSVALKVLLTLSGVGVLAAPMVGQLEEFLTPAVAVSSATSMGLGGAISLLLSAWRRDSKIERHESRYAWKFRGAFEGQKHASHRPMPTGPFVETKRP